jgi:hypothetical protein
VVAFIIINGKLTDSAPGSEFTDRRSDPELMALTCGEFPDDALIRLTGAPHA